MERLTEKVFGFVQLKACGNDFCKETCAEHDEEKSCKNCHIQKAFEKLAEYEDLDEQGLLLRLPCGIGADIYFIPSKTNYKLNILQGYPESNRVYHQNVEKISFTQYGWYLECDKDIEYATGQIFIDKSYKETWFLTQEEAEQKLKEMESD